MSDDVRSHLTAVVIRTQQDAAAMYAGANDGRVLDVDLLLRVQDRMARLHATVAEGLDWLADDKFMREWQERVDDADAARESRVRELWRL